MQSGTSPLLGAAHWGDLADETAEPEPRGGASTCSASTRPRYAPPSARFRMRHRREREAGGSGSDGILRSCGSGGGGASAPEHVGSDHGSLGSVHAHDSRRPFSRHDNAAAGAAYPPRGALRNYDDEPGVGPLGVNGRDSIERWGGPIMFPRGIRRRLATGDAGGSGEWPSGCGAGMSPPLPRHAHGHGHAAMRDDDDAAFARRLQV